LLEAILLSLIGGAVGIVFGYFLSYAITFFSNWETSVSWWSILLAVGVSSGVGIVFGYFPAKKAAELNPIDALRYE
jgi:putative ABC transport system permease protein